MNQKEEIDLFKFMQEQVEWTMRERVLKEPQAFARWFIEMYFLKPHDIVVSDGSRDGKIDAFFTTHNGEVVRHHVLNCKYTREFSKMAPVQFYDEITSFKQAFDHKEQREGYLSSVKDELVPFYRKLFDRYDAGQAELMFLTNCKRNAGQFERVRGWTGLQVLHLDELLQHVVDDYDVAMPQTSPLTFHGVAHLLTADSTETHVPTSIVFARVIDFIDYLREDPHNLLLARNVRVYKGPTQTNKDIRKTFQKQPSEFVYSNNGITVLCEKAKHDPANGRLELANPRVVNGGQTLMSIRDVDKPSKDARVMVRIITLERSERDLPREHAKRREIISKIAERSNMQNPIKKWDLRCNDDFQLEVYRYFRRRNVFYERRPGEWSQRSRELKSVGIQRGPSIVNLSRFIACYNYDDQSRLGPVAAKWPQALSEGDAYAKITRTSPEMAHQINHIGELVIDCRKRLARQNKQIAAMKGAMDWTLVSLVMKALREVEVKWGKPTFTGFLESAGSRKRDWDSLVKSCWAMIHSRYKEEKSRLWKRKRETMDPWRFFKNQLYVDGLLDTPLTREVRTSTQILLQSGIA